MQKLTTFNPNETLDKAIPKLSDDILTVLSSSSGNAFPTDGLQVGMVCYRTDLEKAYMLTSLDGNTPTWTLLLSVQILPGVAEFDSEGHEIAKYYAVAESVPVYKDKSNDVVPKEADFCPPSDASQSLGKDNKAWKELHAKAMYAETLTATGQIKTTGDVVTNGLTAAGNISAAKVFNAVYNDYAEFFERGEPTEEGDIIAIDESTGKFVKADSNSRFVVGVHTESYAQIIGGKKSGNYEEDNKESYIPVSLAGRVPVKVKGKINIGDYIYPSDKKGVGIASKDLKTNYVGRALESSDAKGVRLIKILVMR